MLEKICAAVVIAATSVGLWGIKEMDLPIYISIPLVIVGTIVYLMGIVFFFAEGTILISSRRAEITLPVEVTLKDAA